MENLGTDAFTDEDLTCDRSDFGKQEGQSSLGFFTFCFKLPTVRKESNIATQTTQLCVRRSLYIKT